MEEHITFVMYDGIQNSVFTSMVLTPLLKQLNDSPNLIITLVSLERVPLTPQQIFQSIPKHDRLCFKWIGRSRFFGASSLNSLAKKLKIAPGKIIARGPLAGYVVLKATKGNITVQARGLCAEEYRYTKTTKNFLLKHLYMFMYKQFKKIETAVYSSPRVFIQSVSPALKTYLVEHFDADQKKITLTDNDLPEKLTLDQVKSLKVEIRKELKIDPNKFVYCYSGSAHPWQCAGETIKYFKKKLTENNNAFLLILSKDKQYFLDLLHKEGIEFSRYRVLCVEPNELQRYLAACDAGLLFRKKDVINWVSRPTKMLEYQACGLTVIHNNTIGWLSK